MQGVLLLCGVVYIMLVFKQGCDDAGMSLAQMGSMA